jgi:hypothetical protein
MPASVPRATSSSTRSGSKPRSGRAAIDDHRGGTGAGGEVGELEGDEPSADEEHPAGQVVEVKEGGAVDEMLGAGEVHRTRPRPGGDQEMRRLVGATVDDEPVVALKGRPAMEGLHPRS